MNSISRNDVEAMLLCGMQRTEFMTVSSVMIRAAYPGYDPHPYQIFAETMHNRETGRTDVSQVRQSGEEQFFKWVGEQGWSAIYNHMTNNYVLQKVKRKELRLPVHTPGVWIEEPVNG